MDCLTLTLTNKDKIVTNYIFTLAVSCRRLRFSPISSNALHRGRRSVITFFSKGRILNTQRSRMKFENVLHRINGFGRFQKMIMALGFVGRFALPCNFLLNNFIAAVPSHHCDISSLEFEGVFRNLSQEEKLLVSIPVREDGTLHSCQMFAEPQYHLLLPNSSTVAPVLTVPCRSGWVYDNSTFKSTLTSEVRGSICSNLCELTENHPTPATRVQGSVTKTLCAICS